MGRSGLGSGSPHTGKRGLSVAASVRWYEEVQPATAAVPCGGQEHRVTWRRGKLVLEDHSLGAERALLALGGQPCPCMMVLKMWRDQWKMPPEMLRQMATWLGPNAFLAPAELELPRQLAKVRNWERSWRRSSYITKHGALLEDDLRRLAADELGRFVELWAVPAGSITTPALSVQLARAGHPPSLVGGIEGGRPTLVARLGVPWITVWGWGAAVVDDGFVLEVVDEDAARIIVRAARWDGSDASAGVVAGQARLARRAEGDWSLTWLDDPAVRSP